MQTPSRSPRGSRSPSAHSAGVPRLENKNQNSQLNVNLKKNFISNTATIVWEVSTLKMIPYPKFRLLWVSCICLVTFPCPCPLRPTWSSSRRHRYPEIHR